MGFFRGELGKTFDELQEGETAGFVRQVTRQDVLQYMSLSGDLNPVYADSAYAGRTRYELPVVPANMLAGYAMGGVATLLPGLGSLTHSHSYRLIHPARVGDELTAQMKVVERKTENRRVIIRYEMRDQAHQVVLVGEMEVEPPEKLKPILHHAYENF